MIRTILFSFLTLIIGLVVGYVIGKIGHQKHYIINTEKKFDFKGEELFLVDFNEFNGIGFFDTNRTKICLNHNFGNEIKLYESQGIFQEGIPYVKDLSIVDNSIKFNDGEREITVIIENIKIKSAQKSDSAEEVKHNIPMGEVLLKNFGDIYKSYGHEFEIDNKLYNIADISIERYIKNDQYGKVDIKTFNDQLRVFVLWRFGFNIKITDDGKTISMRYDDSDQVYENLPKINKSDMKK
jgi:hypothetical protein